MEPILQMQGITKSFGGVHALTDVNLEVRAGEIHALLGENGAGKSTLMNILTGVIPMDSGTIRFDGKPYPHPTISMMEKAGIAFVHQELSVINDLTVYENIFLNREIQNRWRVLDKKAMIAQSHELFEGLGVDMDHGLGAENQRKAAAGDLPCPSRQGETADPGRAHHRSEQRGNRPPV